MLTLFVRWILRALPLLYMGLIWYLSSQPSDAIIRFGIYDSFIKESLHLVEFALLYLFWIGAFLTIGPVHPSYNRFAVIISILYGAVDEWHQYFVPYRSATFIDFVKDAIGVLVMWYLFHTYYYKQPHSRFGRVLRWITETFGHEVMR